MKNKFFSLLILPLLISCNVQKKLPLPEPISGIRGEQFGIDAHINEETIDEYLERDDCVYRDSRMLIDPAEYGAIGGDSYLSGFVKGFKVVPYPFLAPVSGLPGEVGTGYVGPSLFAYENDKYIASYKESMDIISSLYPKDKAILLMCGGGGYASMTKNLLIGLGYNKDKIYNVGGFWYYQGKNRVDVKKVDQDGNETYDFGIVDYYEIDFDKLTKI